MPYIKFRPETDEKIYENGDCRMYLYRNADVNEYNSYIKVLVSQGYEVLQQNENYGNYFTSLKKDVQINIYFSPCDGVMRITEEKIDNFLSLSPTECIGNGETAFYCFESDHTLIDCGMCLMVQCPDKSFFVVDGGHYFQPNDNDRIHQFMRQRTPDGQKIVINGWLVTHTHTDHISKLMDFLKYNCDDVIIEGFYTNLLPESYEIEDWGREEQAYNEKFRRILADLKDIPNHRLHSGQRIYLRNMTIDVVCTHEDVYPEKIEDFNDSSTVIMLTSDNTKIFIPGDASGLSDDVIKNRYGKKLKCDIVQISHHGHFGLSTETYENLSAKVAVFPVTRIKFDEEYPRFEANRRAIELADEYYISSDGTVKITLPYENGNAEQLPDETFEDFRKINRLWGYDYTDEYKQELYDLFIKNGGDPDKIQLPIDCYGTFLD